MLHEVPQEADSVVFACELAASDTPYCIMPYLVQPSGAVEMHPELAVRISIYADVPFTLGDARKGADGQEHGVRADGTGCICWGYGRYPNLQNESLCWQLRLFNSLKRMERGMERQLKFLEGLQPHEVQ